MQSQAPVLSYGFATHANLPELCAGALVSRVRQVARDRVNVAFAMTVNIRPVALCLADLLQPVVNGCFWRCHRFFASTTGGAPGAASDAAAADAKSCVEGDDSKGDANQGRTACLEGPSRR